jgi:LDH2 family malate/lactate/ureidoglycolate dehydrogenase
MTEVRIAAQDLESYAKAIMRANGVDDAQLEVVAKNTIWCDLIGRASYGVLRLPILMKRVRHGVLKCPCNPVFREIAPALAHLDGDAGMGHYVAELAMTRAIELARAHGVGVVGVRNSNYYGTGGYFVNLAAQAGMVSMAFTNSYPKVAAYGGIKPVLGTNPIGFGAPRRNGQHLLLSMATSMTAGSKIREYLSKGAELPAGIAIDSRGNPITDPSRFDEGAMLPVGGAKGYGLALMVEILSGVITGAGTSHSVASMYFDFTQSADIGHFFVALDISRWMPLEQYFDRMEGLVALLKASGGSEEVLLPGEVRWRNYANNSQFGIPIDAKTRQVLEGLSEPHGIPPPWGKV